MGGIAPRAQDWTRSYEIKIDDWHQKIDATVGTNRRSVVIMSVLHRLRDDLHKNHPFHKLIGTKICDLDSVDLGQAIAEVDRVIKPSRHWIFWKSYQPTIRSIFPGYSRRAHELGFVIANPVEQKKLLTFFRDALIVVDSLD